MSHSVQEPGALSRMRNVAFKIFNRMWQVKFNVFGFKLVLILSQRLIKTLGLFAKCDTSVINSGALGRMLHV